jgi:EAL domain-containing protein (putative c-di-GMP-specific phosphodiesterase class I)
VPLAGARDDAAHHEILLRMIDEAGNVVPPMAFIPAAERYGIMPAIDRWVVRSLFQQHGQFLRDTAAGNGGDGVLFAVNLSGATVNDDKFMDFLRDQMALHSIPPQVLCFEITETAAITNLNKASYFMHKLKQVGCRFALDDFGSGMSSFAYLKNLPVDFLKIDGSFVVDMTHDPVDYALVEAINRIGHVLGIRTIAESAETPAILRALEELGVDYVQGDAIAAPRLLESFAQPAIPPSPARHGTRPSKPKI